MATMEGVNNGSSAAAIGSGFLRKIIGWAHWISMEWQFMFIDYYNDWSITCMPPLPRRLVDGMLFLMGNCIVRGFFHSYRESIFMYVQLPVVL